MSTKKKTSKEQERLNFVMTYYQGKPIPFFEDILQVELDDQQKQMLKEVDFGCRIMVKSGKGTGKSFMLAGLIFYFLLCFPDVFIRTLSPSYDQLLGVLMREARNHHQRMLPEIAKHYEIAHDKIYMKDIRTNSMECVSAKTTKTERLGGMHSFTQVLLFDEASGIPDEAYYMSLSSMGTAHEGGFVIGVSNPERGDESFYYNLFAKDVEGWDLMTFTGIASAQVKPKFIQDMENLYGLESDEYRVAILGEFPRSDGSSYIPMSIVEDSIQRTADRYDYARHPTVIGVDVARSKSGDKTVFAVRQGSKLLDLIAFQTADTMETVARLRDVDMKYNASAIYMDADGVGGPVADRCRELQMHVIDVRGGLPSTRPRQYANVRTQCWGEMREWLDTADIPDHYDLKRELGTMKWGYDGKMAERLVSKKQLVDKRGKRISSPDHADALAYTFHSSCLSISTRKTKAITIQKRAWV